MMQAKLVGLWADDDGVTTVEYVVLLCGLIIGATAIWLGLSQHVEAAIAGARSTFTSLQH